MDWEDKTASILAELMTKHGLNQTELSRLTGVAQSTISRILNPLLPKGIKSPSDIQVRSLSAYFQVSTDQLRGYAPLAGEVTSDGISTVPLPDAWDVWLQKLGQIQDPRTLRALRGVIAQFADSSLTYSDARILEDITKRFTQDKA